FHVKHFSSFGGAKTGSENPATTSENCSPTATGRAQIVSRETIGSSSEARPPRRAFSRISLHKMPAFSIVSRETISQVPAEQSRARRALPQLLEMLAGRAQIVSRETIYSSLGFRTR